MNLRKLFCAFLVIAAGLFMAGSAWGAAGDVVWEKQFNFLPLNQVVINANIASATTLVICGFAKYYDNSPGQIGFIKAFDIATGNPRWEKTLTLGNTGNGFGVMALNNDVLIVRGGYSDTANPPNLPFTLNKTFIRGYQVDTGQQLWEDLREWQVNSMGNPPGPAAAIVANNLVFMYFSPISPSGATLGDCIIRAYQSRNAGVPSAILLDD
jgi:outer membrane protein assembly factor BamB